MSLWCPYEQFIQRNAYNIAECIRMFLHDMCKSHVENTCYRGDKKLKRTSLYSCKRIFNLYGFDEYFFTNRKLINYIVYGELKKEQDHSDRY